ncbi:MAG: hypothetical protein DMG79_08895 [Acidobacteria bacterium]|nr:MAG: hypothetical protein DMG79_08895 [Acidobacteriota bacterium]
MVAVLALAFEIVPMFTDSSTQASSAQPAAPPTHVPPRIGSKSAKKPRVENLDPTLRLDLLASSEKTVYQGTGRNIFVSQAEDVHIPIPQKNGTADGSTPRGIYVPPAISQTPIPLKFYGFASRPGEPKKVFLKSGEDVFVAGEGEIVDRRYKVIRISATSVEIQDVVNSGPPQSIPLTQG